jgi:large subunit ribosomal protein L3
MSLGLIGRKIGMMRVFTEAGLSIPVTVVDVSKHKKRMATLPFNWPTVHVRLRE